MDSCEILIHILQGCFPDTEAIGRLPRCQWNNPEWHGANLTIPNHTRNREHCAYFLGCTSGHYSDVLMGAIASQITSLVTVYSVVYWGAGQRKHQSFASLAFVRGIHRRPVNCPHKWPITRKMFPFDGVITWAPGLNKNYEYSASVTKLIIKPNTLTTTSTSMTFRLYYIICCQIIDYLWGSTVKFNF